MVKAKGLPSWRGQDAPRFLSGRHAEELAG